MKKLNLSALATSNNLIQEENIKNDISTNIEWEKKLSLKSINTKDVNLEIKTDLNLSSQNKKLTLKDLNIKVDLSKNVDEDIDEINEIETSENNNLNEQLEFQETIQHKLKIALKTNKQTQENQAIEESNKQQELENELVKKQELKIQDSETNLSLQTQTTNEIFSNYIPSTKKQEDLNVNQTEKNFVKTQEEKEVEIKKVEKIEIKKVQTKKQDFKIIKNLIIKLNSLNLKLVLNLTKFKFYVKNLFKINLKNLKIIEKTKNKKVYIPVTVWFLWVFWVAIFMFQQNNIQTYQIKSNVQEIQKISTGIINQEVKNDNVNINKVNTIDNNTKSHKIKKELKEFLLKNQK